MSLTSPRRSGADAANRFGPRGSLLAVTLPFTAAVCAFGTLQANDIRATQEQLEYFRASGDLTAQRRHGWSLLSQLAELSNGRPAIESWYDEGAVFAAEDEPAIPGLLGFTRPNTGHRKRSLDADSGDAAILDFTLYNAPAYEHIRRHRLYQTSELDQLLVAGETDRTIVGNRMIPAFPREAMVLKTAWWPIANEDVTALPVWDPELNPERPQGNPYTTWQRIVAVDTRSLHRLPRIATLEFAGRTIPISSWVKVNAFYHVVVDASLAIRLNADRDARKVALITLGRTLREGDALALIGVHLASHEIDDWVWVTFWWHDRPDEGKYAAGRPRAQDGAGRSYLMQTAFDAVKPVTPDGSPHVSFNPWFEGRFPNGGHGGGAVSNCVACHSRASYPAIDFLPVTRGPADLLSDAAYDDGRLRTSFLWSIALRATP